MLLKRVGREDREAHLLAFYPEREKEKEKDPAVFPFLLLQTVLTCNWIDAFISKEKEIIIEFVWIIFWREDIMRVWIPSVIWGGASCLDHYPSLLNSRIINWANISRSGKFTCTITGQQQHTYSFNVNKIAIVLRACVLYQMPFFSSWLYPLQIILSIFTYSLERGCLLQKKKWSADEQVWFVCVGLFLKEWFWLTISSLTNFKSNLIFALKCVKLAWEKNLFYVPKDFSNNHQGFLIIILY